MTREIKFRAWDTPFNKMIYDNSLITINLDGTVNYGNAELTSRDTYLQYPIVLMQFTGLKDKNGKEIYEGDIVQEVDGKNKYNNNYVIYPIGTEESSDGRPCLCPAFPLQQKCCMYDISNDTNKFIVIGNIYENPELLTTK